MASLATTVQLADRLKIVVDPIAAQSAVDCASGLVRRIARQQIDFVPQETVILLGTGQILVLPERPVVVDAQNPLTVTELGDFGSIDVTLVERRDFMRVNNELTRGYPFWANTSRLMGWPLRRPLGIWAPRVQVTYSHGYQTVPDDVVSFVLDVAAALYDNPTGIRSLQIDDYSETKATEVLGAALVEQLAVKLGVAGRRRRSFSIIQGSS